MRIFALLCVFFFHVTANALTKTEETALGFAAGEYLGAVAINAGFKQTKCAQYLQIPSIWYDLNYAIRDVQTSVPDVVKGKRDLLKESMKDLMSLKQNTIKELANVSEADCPAYAKRTRNITVPLINKWNDIK